MWTGRLPGGESLVQHHQAKPLKSLGVGKSLWQGDAPQKAVPGPREGVAAASEEAHPGCREQEAPGTGYILWPALSHCSFLQVLRFLPQVQPQPSLLPGVRNLERSLGLPAKVTQTGLTQVLCGCFYPMAVPSRLLTWLRFTPACTHLCGAQVVLLVVPPAAPAFALPSTATTRQRLSSPRAVWRADPGAA